MPFTMSPRLFRAKPPRGGSGGVSPTGQTAFFMDGGDSNTATGMQPNAQPGIPATPSPSVKEFKQSLNAGAGGIQTAVEPQEHLQNWPSNIGHGISFAKLYSAQTGHDVCLIPVAYGGSGFSGTPVFDWRGDTNLFLQAVNRWKAAWPLIASPKFAGGIIFSINTNNAGTVDANSETERLITRFRTELASFGMSATTPAVFIQVNGNWIDNPTILPASRCHLPDGKWTSPARWAIHETIKDVPNYAAYTGVVPNNGFMHNLPTDYTHHDDATQKNIIGPAILTALQQAIANASPPGFKTKPLATTVTTLTQANGTFTLGGGSVFHNPQPTSQGRRLWRADNPQMIGKVVAASSSGNAALVHTPNTADGQFYQGERWGINVNGEHNYFTTEILENIAPGVPAPLSFNLGTNLQGLEGGKIDANGDAIPLPGTAGTNYFIPNPAVVTELSAKGFNVYRIPFLAERIQPTILGALDSAYAGYIQDLVTQISALTPSSYAVLDLHNYNKRRLNNATESDTVYGTASMPISNLTDLWSKIANVYKTNGKAIFGLMNEPIFDRTNAQLISDYNQVIAAIRATGAKNRLTIPLPEYNNAHKSVANGLLDFITGIVDSYHTKHLFEIHLYFDTNENGGNDGAVLDTTYQDCIHYVFMRLQHATELCRTYGHKLIIGETGLAAFPDALIVTRELMNFIRENLDVIQFTCTWASGRSPSPNDAYVYKFNARNSDLAEERPQTTIAKTRMAADNFPYPGLAYDWRYNGRFHGGSESALTSFDRPGTGWDFHNFENDGETLLEAFAQDVKRITEGGMRLENESSNIWKCDDFAEGPGYTPINLSFEELSGNTRLYFSPDRLTKSARMIEGTANGVHEIEYSAISTPNPSTPHAFSYWFKHDPKGDIYPWISGSKGDSSEAREATAINSGVQAYRKGNYVRVASVLTDINPAFSSVRLRIGLNAAASGGSSLSPASYTGLGRTLDIFNMMIEPDSLYAGTPIPKYGAGIITRPAELYKPEGAFFTAMQGSFTLIMEVQELPAFAIELPLFQLNGIDLLQIRSTHRIRCLFGTPATFETGVFRSVTAADASAAGSRFRHHPIKCAVSIDRTLGRIIIGALDARNSGTETVTFDGAIPAVTTARFANHGGKLRKYGLKTSGSTAAELLTLLENY